MLLVSRCSPFSFSGEVYLKSGVISSFSCKSQWGEHINVPPSVQAAGIKPNHQGSQFLPYVLLCVRPHVHAHVYHSLHGEVRGRFSSSPTLPSWGLNSAHQAWSQTPLPSEPLFQSFACSPLVGPGQTATPVCLSAFSSLASWEENPVWSVAIRAELLASLWAIQC